MRVAATMLHKVATSYHRVPTGSSPSTPEIPLSNFPDRHRPSSPERHLLDQSVRSLDRSTSQVNFDAECTPRTKTGTAFPFTASDPPVTSSTTTSPRGLHLEIATRESDTASGVSGVTYDPSPQSPSGNQEEPSLQFTTNPLQRASVFGELPLTLPGGKLDRPIIGKEEQGDHVPGVSGIRDSESIVLRDSRDGTKS